TPSAIAFGTAATAALSIAFTGSFTRMLLSFPKSLLLVVTVTLLVVLSRFVVIINLFQVHFGLNNAFFMSRIGKYWPKFRSNPCREKVSSRLSEQHVLIGIPCRKMRNN